MFKVCAVNAAGKGKLSDVSEAVCVKALPGDCLYNVLNLSVIIFLIFSRKSDPCT